jgi:hypothetical protein
VWGIIPYESDCVRHNVKNMMCAVFVI